MFLLPLAMAFGFTFGLFTAYVAQYRTPCGNNTFRHRLAHISGTHTLSVCWAGIGRMVGEGMSEGLRKGSEHMSEIITYEGVNYREVDRKAMVGDLITYDFEGIRNVIPRKVIEVTHEVARFKPYFDVKEFDEVDGYAHYAYRVLEEIAEPQPEVTDLIANLGRRVHELEGADAVNSPAHYKRGDLETIDIIAHITAGYDDPFVAYCVGNAVKYEDRAPYKHDSPAECLRKAAWYLTKAADHIESKGAS